MDGSEPTLTDLGAPVESPAAPAEATPEPPAAAAVTRRRRWPKRVAIGLSVVFGLLFALYAVALYDVWSTSRQDEARPVDAIVVLGAAQYDGRPSPQLAARLDHAIDLYRRGLAPKIFVTGGKQPLDRFTEATAEARYLQDRGVPVDALMREDEGRTSWQSLSAVADAMKGDGLHSVLLVSDPFHSARIKGMATELG
ncbi:MAG TPA: YdcF family protein, partial [Acidimicrobiales bacterium]|nr:YdcF family protein [Acidimicrobiales bacterium]